MSVCLVMWTGISYNSFHKTGRQQFQPSFNLHFSGKTSLAKSLSTIASTAAFDKNPQSKERGITLDLGFSSFQVDSPSHISDQYDCVQYTLVDCPGHGKFNHFQLKSFFPKSELLCTLLELSTLKFSSQVLSNSNFSQYSILTGLVEWILY